MDLQSIPDVHFNLKQKEDCKFLTCIYQYFNTINKDFSQELSDLPKTSPASSQPNKNTKAELQICSTALRQFRQKFLWK